MTEQLELAPQNTIRIETALSRFPVHKLARKRGGILIDIKETTSAGEIKTRWKVSYNSEYGQPGPLAYKVDSLIINRRIDDERPSIPKIIKLGSLSELCRELGARRGGGNANDIKKALMQNVGAIINAKLSYKASDGTERTIEAGFSRYSVIFTGERFSDGRKANAVYLVLNDLYMKVLNEAQTRPLDYDYLRDLPPAAQRFYELIGFQIYAVLKHERPRARLLYSDFCTRAPQTCYDDWEHVRKQMYKVHAPHLKSGYLAKVEFQEQRGESGELDWLMLYTPGRRAQAEFREASKKPRRIQRPSATPLPSLQATTAPEPPARQERQSDSPISSERPEAAAIYSTDPESEQLISRLIKFHIAETTARELVRDYRKSVELQLRALPHRNINKIKDFASWLIAAIKENYQLPEQIIAATVREEEVKHAIAKKEAELERQQRREALQPAYYDYLRGRTGEIEKEQAEAYRAFLAKEAEERLEIENSRTYKPKFKAHLLANFDEEESHLDRRRDYFHEPTLDEWIEQNPDARTAKP
ncbi:MAG TPA: hypothetical protein VK619_05705 [Pyrinomonadaceae bacterium]|nr:hypothetical protein [Pyrinomonadaceae bacterium]